ncbi:MAG: dihydroorotase, partial [Alphaproteobacteria bacterium]
PGIPAQAETMMLERDLALVELTGVRYHAAQISCARSLEAVRRAKARGLPVSCGTSINHLTLNENDIGSYRTFFKMRPPLRPEEDRMAIVEGLINGDIDVLVSAHDPKDADSKRRPFVEAGDGAVGLETMLAAALRLYHNGDISLPALLKPMTTNPASLLGLPGGRLAKGEVADLIVVDIGLPWIVDPDLLHSKSKNTPFDESKLQGRVLHTFVAGKPVDVPAGGRRAA